MRTFDAVPTLRPIPELARPDAKFFVEAVLPALAAAGYAGTVALVVTDGTTARAQPSDDRRCEADVVIEGSAEDLEALLAGKLNKSRGALDRVTAGATDGPLVKGSPSSLRALVSALTPQQRVPLTAKDIGDEMNAAMATKRDRMRTIDGRYIKGMRATKESAPPSAPVLGAVLGGPVTAPMDRAGIALQNLAAFVNAGLLGVSDNDPLVVVRRV
jgi:hypothetical protein